MTYLSGATKIMCLLWDTWNRMKSEQRCLCFNQFWSITNSWSYAHLSALGTNCMFFRVWRQTWRRTAFSRAWHWLHVFPRLALDLAPNDVFPRLTPIACFVRRWLYLAFVSDAVSFAFSFIASVKTEPFLLLSCKHNVLEKLYGLSCFPQLLACSSLLL